MYNILVTGVGSIIGYGIIDGLKKSSIPTTVFGTDIYEDGYGGVIADHFIKGVRADSDGYISFINNVINKHKIDLIIPGIEQDLYKLWENKDTVKTNIVFNNELCIRLSRNKFCTFEYLSDFDIDLIPTLHQTSYQHCAETLGLPFLIKPEFSYASKGIEPINNEREFDFYTEKLGGKCIYQRIVGTAETEYTISVFGDGSGGMLDYIILKRKLSREGATNKATIVDDSAVLEYVQKLTHILKPIGPLNIQLRKDGDKVYLLEINPRLSSACSIRTILGYNEPEMCLKYFLTKEKIVPATKKQGTVIRYISDYYFQK
jgi:carbamoyl-phosphate synthase large subunit